MCIGCKNSLLKHFPLATTKEQMDLLWCGTCFPADHGDCIEEQLAELEVKSNGNIQEAMDIAHQEFDEAWERDRPLREKWKRESDEADEAWQRDCELARQPGS